MHACKFKYSAFLLTNNIDLVYGDTHQQYISGLRTHTHTHTHTLSRVGEAGRGGGVGGGGGVRGEIRDGGGACDPHILDRVDMNEVEHAKLGEEFRFISAQLDLTDLNYMRLRPLELEI